MNQARILREYTVTPLETRHGVSLNRHVYRGDIWTKYEENKADVERLLDEGLPKDRLYRFYEKMKHSFPREELPALEEAMMQVNIELDGQTLKGWWENSSGGSEYWLRDQLFLGEFKDRDKNELDVTLQRTVKAVPYDEATYLDDVCIVEWTIPIARDELYNCAADGTRRTPQGKKAERGLGEGKEGSIGRFSCSSLDGDSFDSKSGKTDKRKRSGTEGESNMSNRVTLPGSIQSIDPTVVTTPPNLSDTDMTTVSNLKILP